MYPSFSDIMRSVLPMSAQKKQKLAAIESLLDKEQFKEVSYLFRTKKIDIIYSRYGISTALMEDAIYPELVIKTKDDEVKKFIGEINSDIQDRAKKGLFKELSKNAEAKILQFIAPNIFGLEHVKEAAMLQLFSSEPVHILLLGDPGTGKTDILKSVSQLHPITSFGLGSGTSGAGLGIMMRGDEMVKGLLPRADNGICCIDELNLMKREDYAFLYNAMEKGTISYDKANKHIVLDTRVRVLATANPTGDKFVGKGIDILRKQIPFDSALLSRFHLVFIIRKPDIEGFVHITKKIIDGQKVSIHNKDIDFIKDYVTYAESITCDFPKSYQDNVIDFVEKLKRREEEFLAELSPRIVIGLIRMCKARARMYLRSTVAKEDLEAVKTLLENALTIREKKQ